MHGLPISITGQKPDSASHDPMERAGPANPDRCPAKGEEDQRPAYLLAASSSRSSSLGLSWVLLGRRDLKSTVYLRVTSRGPVL